MSGEGVSSFDEHVHSDERVPDHVEDPPAWLDYLGLEGELDAAAEALRGALETLGDEPTHEAVRDALAAWVAAAIPEMLAHAPTLILRLGFGAGRFFERLRRLAPPADHPHAANASLIISRPPGADASHGDSVF